MRQGIVLLFILIILFCTSSYGGTFGGGSGTLNDPYRISEPAHLVELANAPGTPFPNYCYYCLTQNIDMTGIDITPIGYPFYGSFDGNGHTISNLTIDGAYESAGLFGQVGSLMGGPTGNILNLHVENVSISGIKVAGAIAGNLYRGSIINCSSSGSVHATGTFFNDGAWAGGIAGSLWGDGTIQKCTSNCSVTALDDIGGSCAGGISAEVRGNVSDCYSTGLINARYAGGLSCTFGPGNISNCYSAVTFDEDCYEIGGISYRCSDGTFTNCFWDTETSNTTVGVAVGIDPDPNNVTGLTTVQMKQQSNFTNWDFLGESTNGENDIWRMCVDGIDYPHLSWEYAQNGDFACGDGTDILDLQALAERWLLTEALNPTTFSYACDANGDGVIDLLDYSVLGVNW